MTNELEPCPFCHGALAVNQDEDGWWHHSCTEYCYLSAGFPTKEEAIIAANTRCKRTCKMIPLLHTTNPVAFYCSECDSTVYQVAKFCPHCGSEVVDDNS